MKIAKLKNIKREDTEQQPASLSGSEINAHLCPGPKKVKDMAHLNQAQSYTIEVMCANKCFKVMIANTIGVNKSTII